MAIRAILVGVLAQILVFGYGVSKIDFANIYVTGHSIKIPGSALVKYHLGIGTLIGNYGVIEDQLKPFVQPWIGATYDRLDMENYKRFLDYLTAGQFAENERKRGGGRSKNKKLFWRWHWPDGLRRRELSLCRNQFIIAQSPIQAKPANCHRK